MEKLSVIQEGESFEFSFPTKDVDSESPVGWVCTISLKQYPGDSSAITPRIIALNAAGDAWSGFLTSTETTGLALGLWYLTATFVNATTDELQQDSVRFSLSKKWA